MSIVKLHKGIVVKGKFKPDDPVAFKLDFCRDEGKRVEVTKKERLRSGLTIRTVIITELWLR